MATTVQRQRMFVGGDWYEGSGEGAQPVVNPATGEVIAEVPKGTQADVDHAVATARNPPSITIVWPVVKLAEGEMR